MLEVLGIHMSCAYIMSVVGGELERRGCVCVRACMCLHMMEKEEAKEREGLTLERIKSSKTALSCLCSIRH